MKEGFQRETLNRMGGSKGKSWPGAKLFQAKRISSCIKMLNCKTNPISVQEGGEKRGRRRRREEKRGGGGPVGPNSHTKMDFLLAQTVFPLPQKNNWNEHAQDRYRNKQMAYLIKRKITHLQ